jgi:transposase InsO family protein
MGSDNGDHREVNGQILVPYNQRYSFVDLLHRTCGHGGHSTTMRMLKLWNFYMIDITKVVADVLKKCQPCIVGKGKRGKRLVLPQAVAPFDYLSLDILHLFPNCKCLVTVDRFSRYVTATILEKEDSVSVIHALERVLMTFGFPKYLLMDNGPCFSSKAFKCWCDQFDIKQNFTAIHQPRSNGQVERINGILREGMKVMCAGAVNSDGTVPLSMEEIDLRLQIVVYRVNSGSHPNLKKLSPRDIVFGFRERCPFIVFAKSRPAKVFQGNFKVGDIIAAKVKMTSPGVLPKFDTLAVVMKHVGNNRYLVARVKADGSVKKKTFHLKEEQMKFLYPSAVERPPSIDDIELNSNVDNEGTTSESSADSDVYGDSDNSNEN